MIGQTEESAGGANESLVAYARVSADAPHIAFGILRDVDRYGGIASPVVRWANCEVLGAAAA
jgi:hypothetical protein